MGRGAQKNKAGLFKFNLMAMPISKAIHIGKAATCTLRKETICFLSKSRVQSLPGLDIPDSPFTALVFWLCISLTDWASRLALSHMFKRAYLPSFSFPKPDTDPTTHLVPSDHGSTSSFLISCVFSASGSIRHVEVLSWASACWTNDWMGTGWLVWSGKQSQMDSSELTAKHWSRNSSLNIHPWSSLELNARNKTYKEQCWNPIPGHRSDQGVQKWPDLQTCDQTTKQFHPRIQLILKKSRLPKEKFDTFISQSSPRLAQCGSNVLKSSPGIFSDRKYGSQQTTGRWLLHFPCKVTCKPNTPRQSPLQRMS